MLTSFALMMLCAIFLSEIMQRLQLPRILGMLITGIILGPYTLNLLAPEILNIAVELRQIALIIILTRAGLALDLVALKKVGKPAILMSFIPATFEIIATTILAPLLFAITYLEAAIMGAILGAVSPAIIVPKMIRLAESGYGNNKSIPQLIMAAASVDDIYVIILFNAFMNMASGRNFDSTIFIKIPVAIIIGLLWGILCGISLCWLFKQIHIRDTIKVLIILSISFLLVTLETKINKCLPMSGLLAVLTFAVTIFRKNQIVASRIANKFSKIWVLTELILFILVGATVDLQYVTNTGFNVIILLFFILVIRSCGVLFCFFKTNLNWKERLFCIVAYFPKATVQAAIAAIPLVKGIKAGNIILTVAVLAILITAPIGAIAIDLLEKKILKN